MNGPAQAPQRDQGQPALADRLRTVRVGTRQDLEVTRHLFRGQAAYAVRDPMTFQSHRFDPADYAVFVAIDRDRELGDIFKTLVADGRLAADDEEKFYQFIIGLHQLNFLSLPISNDKLLYRRHVARKKASRRQKVTGFLFLQIPLVNPNAFLDKTVQYARHVFSRWFFALWLGLMCTAGYVAWQNIGELAQPVQGVLAAGNLPLMWATLIVLKLFHELGHAYACKRYGGYVPEMGVYLIVFTPCAYVDATACWGFNRKRERLIVCLAGMYIESIAAAVAVLVWASASPGIARDIAYNVIILAGIVTVLFNINPLMRFDGYYILSDLVEIPNLRARASKFLGGQAKRWFLNIETPPTAGGTRLRFILLSFGICAMLYRVTIMVGIAAIVAMKVPLVGLGVAAFVLASTLFGLLKRLTRYLWRAEETAPVRRRAIAWSLVALVGVPSAILLAPVPATVKAEGMLGREREDVIRARVDGFVRAVNKQPGDTVAAGDAVVELGHDVYFEGIAQAEAAIKASDIRRMAYETTEPSRAQAEKERGLVARRELAQRRQDLQDLTVRAVHSGKLINGLDQRCVGVFVEKGQPVAMLVSGPWQVRAELTEEQMADAQPTVGDTVQIRSPAIPGTAVDGVITRVAPAGSRTVTSAALTHLGGGEIAIHPGTHQTAQPYFEVTIQADMPDDSVLPQDGVCQVQFGGGFDTLATKLTRRVIRFTNRLAQR